MTGGYDGAKDEPPTTFFWNLEKDTSGFYSGIQAYIRAGSEVRGVVRLKSDEEFEWLRRRIQGHGPKL